MSNKTISFLTAILVGSLAIAAFVLSYSALRELAADHGISQTLSFVWPLLIDASLVIFSLSVLRNSLQGEKVFYGWALVILATGATVAFNVLHAPADTLSRVIASIAPIALFLSFELLMSQVKSEVKRHRITHTLTDLRQGVSELTTKRDALVVDFDVLSDKISALGDKRMTLENDIRTLQKERRMTKKAPSVTTNGVASPLSGASLDIANSAKQERIEERRAQVLTLLDAGNDKSAIADQLGVSPRTVERDILLLNGEVTNETQ